MNIRLHSAAAAELTTPTLDPMPELHGKKILYINMDGVLPTSVTPMRSWIRPSVPTMRRTRTRAPGSLPT